MDKEDLCPSVDGLVVLILLISAALRPRLVLPAAHQPLIQDQINVLRKTMDQVKAFGQAGAALEGQMLLPRRFVEQIIQRPTDPEIFFDYCFWQSLFSGSDQKQFLPLLVAQISYFIHVSAPPQIALSAS